MFPTDGTIQQSRLHGGHHCQDDAARPLVRVEHGSNCAPFFGLPDAWSRCNAMRFTPTPSSETAEKYFDDIRGRITFGEEHRQLANLFNEIIAECTGTQNNI